DGIFMTTNNSWSIDDKRINFQFGCEAAWRIDHGRLTQMYRNPNYTGITPRFWGSCDAVAGREEWVVWGTPNCGKGQPGQIGRVVTQGRVGVASTNDLSPEGASRAAKSAKEMAEVVAADPLWPGLAPRAEVASVDRFYDATADSTPEQRAEVVATLIGQCESG